jgi:glycine/D-amino acid oxidase-like deaminating enzyme
MDVPTFLNATRAWLIKKNLLGAQAESRTEAPSDAQAKSRTETPNDAQAKSRTETPNDARAESREESTVVVNCTGYRAAEIPGWEWLPIRPNKGQVLEVHLPGLSLASMVNFGKFLVPLGEERYRLGATYEFHHPDPQPTEDVKNELLAALREIYSGEVAVMEHRAGYRPTVPDRKPLVGLHPEDASKAIFGGFGSKGVMLVPWCADQFIGHVLEGRNIDKSIDVLRYYARA